MKAQSILFTTALLCAGAAMAQGSAPAAADRPLPVAPAAEAAPATSATPAPTATTDYRPAPAGSARGATGERPYALVESPTLPCAPAYCPRLAPRADRN